VGFARRFEVGLDAQMNLEIAAFKPASAALRQMGRFRRLADPEDSRVEIPGQIFAAGRHCQLDMFDACHSHGVLLSSNQRHRDTMKTILITGGTRGIGRATALKCARSGWSIALNYVNNHPAAEEAAREVRAAGAQAITLQGDVAAEADVISMFREAESRLGRLDGVVINAGIVAPSLPLADMDCARLKRMFDVNVYGAYLCARESARRLSKDRGGGGGAIVLVSSAASRLGSPFEYVDYAGSKGAIDTLTIGLAKELAHAGRARERGTSGTHRYRHPCQRRATRPRAAYRCNHADGPRGATRGSR
jgi:NADP-dependent 3-hydroxy acid dehydrogenase YdfG